MATQKVITYNPFYRGETTAFGVTFTQPYAGYNWATVVLTCSMTSDTAPTSNSDAAAVRTGITMTTDASNNASYTFQLTTTESNALTPGTTYYIQFKLTESGTNVIKPVTGKVVVKQDYDI